MVSMICAIDRNNLLSVNGQIPWHIPEDLSYFSRTTRKKVVVMGRKTYDSLSKPLPNRLNLVLTRDARFAYHPSMRQGAFYTDQPSEIIKFSNPDNVFVIGGREIYSLFAPYTQKLYITVVDSKQEYNGSAVYFPIEDFKNIKWNCSSHVVNKLYSTLVFERIPSETKSNHEGST